MASEIPDVTSFTALSFDCYGTLVDHEASQQRHLEPLRSALPSSHPLSQDGVKLLQRFRLVVDNLETEQPDLRADELHVEAFRRLVSELGLNEHQDQDTRRTLASAADEWRHMAARSEPFSDTVEGLAKLKKHYRLIILSNVDEDNIAKTVEAMRPVQFDAVYTAEKIGSYKPSHKNFRYLFAHAKDDFDVDFGKGDLLHVARSLTADHVPAKELGFRSVWIARGGDTPEGQGVGGDLEELQDKVAFEWKFQTIGDFAAEVERQFEEKARQQS